MLIGHALKSLRQQRNLTLRELADATGLSVGFLSNLERDINSPTITSLNKICQALGASLVNLLQPIEQNRDRVVRKSERQELFQSKKSKIGYQLLSGRGERLKPICISIEPGGDCVEVSLGHETDEFGIILEGSLEITVGGENYLLEEGDSIYIESYSPHKYRNTGNTRCISLWVVQGTSSDIHADG